MKALIALLFTIMVMACSTQSNVSSEADELSVSTLPTDTVHRSAINTVVQGMYPVVITKNIESTRTFFVTWLKFQPVFESTWFILLASPGKNSSMIAFMNEEHPSAPPSPRATKGDGMFLTLEVSDVAKLHQALKNSGAVFTYELTKESWGQHRFALKDPNGIWIDIVAQVEPEAGWWDQYVRRD